MVNCKCKWVIKLSVYGLGTYHEDRWDVKSSESSLTWSPRGSQTASWQRTRINYCGSRKTRNVILCTKINNNYVIITILCVISHLFSSSSEQHSCFKLRCRKGNEIYNSNIVHWQPQIKGTETVLWYWRRSSRSYRNRCTLFNLGESITSCLKYEPVCYVLQTPNDVYWSNQHVV